MFMVIFIMNIVLVVWVFWFDFVYLMKIFDVGVYGVICLMINFCEDVEKFVVYICYLLIGI